MAAQTSGNDQKRFDWPRFWVEHGGVVDLSDGGYLSDPKYLLSRSKSLSPPSGLIWTRCPQFISAELILDLKTIMIGIAALALPSLAASASSAAVLVGAKSVQITDIFFSLPNQAYLQVGEFLAYQAGTNIDVAAAANGGAATAADQWSDGLHGPGRAIDGNENADFYAAPYIYHSQSNAGGLLTIDFGAPTDIKGLAIYGRTDGGFHVRDIYSVTVFDAGNDPLWTGKMDATAGHGAFVSFVPEPATWAFMMLGLGGLGATLRARRRRLGSLSFV